MSRAASMVLALLMACGLAGAAHGALAPNDRQAAFAAEIDHAHLGRIAVHAEGRLKSFGSHARSMMQFVSGPRVIDDQHQMFTYLDLMLRPRAYEDAEIIFIKNKPMRDRIATALLESVRVQIDSAGAAHHGIALDGMLADLEERMARFKRTGLISPLMLNDPIVAQRMSGMRQDLIRTARFVEEVETAIAVMSPDTLRNNLRIVPPPGGGFDDRWLTLEELAHLEHARPHVYQHVDAALKADLLATWRRFQDAWREMDASAVNAASATLADLLPQVNPDFYQSSVGRSGWPWTWTDESSWKWQTSLGLGGLCVILAGLFLGMRRTTAASLALFGAGALAVFHLATTNLASLDPLPLESWYFAARNMTWVWLFYAASLVPLLLAVVFRWRGAHWVGMSMFMLAFGFHTSALLLRWYVSGRWPNSNMFEAVTTAAWWGGLAAIVLELFVRRFPVRGLFAVASAVGSMVALMCAYFMPVGLDPNIRNMMPVLHDVWLYIHVNVTILSYAFIFFAAVTAMLYLLWRFGLALRDRDGTGEFARMGGAGSLIMTTPDGQTYIEKAQSSLGQVLDGTTMMLVELSFILLWTGTVMGAIWADHSWGRPWGWDPKEVFALNTFLVFAVLIHTRLKVKDKGFWTAVIALIGAGVMLFNWIAINFVVTGLHSYA
jgi:cytochrome c-type biogenesis protein CcsB